MKILVVGCGSIGERHVRNLKKFSTVELIVYDKNRRRLLEVSKKYRIRAAESLDSVMELGVDAVLVCTPPNSHVPIAMRAVKYDAHVFIEKPLSHSLEGVDELIKTAKKKKLNILVGYNFRFHPAVRMIKKMLEDGRLGRVLSARDEFGYYLPYWPQKGNYRKSYVARRALGGGIILDGSHNIDYLRWFMGEVKEVFCFAGKISDLEVETEDTAEILLKFKSGAVAEVHLDFTRQEYSRRCELLGEKGTIVWDYPKKLVRFYSGENKRWQTFKVNVGLDEMYVEEIKHFIRCVTGKEKPLIGVEEAQRTLEIALAAKKSARTGRVIKK